VTTKIGGFEARRVTSMVRLWSGSSTGNRRPDDDHDHCEFCWAKFMVDPYEGAAEEILAMGYAVQDRTADEDSPNDHYWICSTCVFAKRFQWTVTDELSISGGVEGRG
jgi:hypothetical protein